MKAKRHFTRERRSSVVVAAILSGAVLWGFAFSANASVFFDWVCADPTCSGDSGFSTFFEFSDAAVASGDFTGVSGNILSAGLTSSVGDGFALDLSDLEEVPGTIAADQSNIRVVLDAARQTVIMLEDVSFGVLLDFLDAAEGQIIFHESNLVPYLVEFRRDFSPVCCVSDDTDIRGQFERRASSTPEPTTLALLGLGLAGLGFAKRRL